MPSDTGTVLLSVEPWAFVQVDNTEKELRAPQAPGALTIPLSEGIHFLLIYRDGYISQQPIFNIAAGETMKLDIKLVPLQ